MAINNRVQDFPETRKLLVEAGYDLSWVVRDGIEEDGLRLYVPKNGNEWMNKLVIAARKAGWEKEDDGPFQVFVNWATPEVGAKIYDAYQREARLSNV